MTEKEVIVRQNMNGQQEFYLLLIGTMLYAYGYGAFALAKMTGSRVMLKQYEQLGAIHTSYLPAVHLDSLRVKMFLAGSYLSVVDENTWLFRVPSFDSNRTKKVEMELW